MRQVTRGGHGGLELPLVLDRSSAAPLSAQLAGLLRTALLAGHAKAGERLPSTRALATELGVSRTVVTEAYDQLYAEGWLDGRHGAGTFVAEEMPGETSMPAPRPSAAPAQPPGQPSGQPSARPPAPPLSAPPVPPPPVPVPVPVPPAAVPSGSRSARAPMPGAIDLEPGLPWVGMLDTPAWRRAWREAAAGTVAGPVSFPVSADPYGLPELRTVLTGHLRRTRGIAVEPDQVMVTRGVTNGLDLLALTMLRPGDLVGVEEPGYVAARAVLEARGARIVPCPVDEHGLIVDDLPPDLRLVYTTPSHQYPLGGVLPVPRRLALIDWARRAGALIVEDDYDAEFRFDVAPLPALYALDPGVVVHLGTTAKTLTVDVGVGWLVAAPDLVRTIAARRGRVKDRVAAVPQQAVRLLMESGELARHIRRMRREYSARRAIVIDELRGLRVRGETAGLHLVVELPAPVADGVVAAAEERGVLLRTLEPYYAGPVPDSATHGLVIGYGGTGRSELRSACSLVRELAVS